MIDTLLDIHNKVVTDFPPTAIKFHYQFNLRDLTNIVDNMMRVKPEHMKTPILLAQLLLHECDRVYMDRLVDAIDREKYSKNITELAVKNLAIVNIPATDSKDKNAQPMQIAIDMNEVVPKPELNKLNIFTNFALGIGDGNYT